MNRTPYPCPSLDRLERLIGDCHEALPGPEAARLREEEQRLLQATAGRQAPRRTPSWWLIALLAAGGAAAATWWGVDSWVPRRAVPETMRTQDVPPATPPSAPEPRRKSGQAVDSEEAARENGAPRESRPAQIYRQEVY